MTAGAVAVRRGVGHLGDVADQQRPPARGRSAALHRRERGAVHRPAAGRSARAPGAARRHCSCLQPAHERVASALFADIGPKLQIGEGSTRLQKRSRFLPTPRPAASARGPSSTSSSPVRQRLWPARQRDRETRPPAAATGAAPRTCARRGPDGQVTGASQIIRPVAASTVPVTVSRSRVGTLARRVRPRW